MRVRVTWAASYLLLSFFWISPRYEKEPTKLSDAQTNAKDKAATSFAEECVTLLLREWGV